jgi:hydroxyacylglutathione hydrolase
MIEIVKVAVTPFAQNARIVWAHGTTNAIVVDPGGDVDRIVAALKERGLTCAEIWLTHSHLDHCGGVKPLIAATGARLIGHPAESLMRSRVRDIAAMYGLPPGELEDCPEPDRFVSGGEIVAVGEETFEVLFTPGHSPGHVCFYNQANGIVIAGDTLFEGSIGRTDLPGGDFEVLMRSIKEVLYRLPPDTAVLPGHGEDTTIGREMRTNPFVTASLGKAGR